MSLSQKKKIYITNTTSLWLLLLGPVFAILNALNGQQTLVLVNLTTSTLGASCLLLSWKRRHHAAAMFLLCGGNIAFFLSALWVNNGMEYTLLICMVGAVFMCEHPALRISFAMASALGFLTIKWLYATGFSAAAFPPLRYGTNVVIFLAGYYWIIEIFRAINNSYHREIERRNHVLSESRRRLNDDHMALSRLTEELRTANITKEKLFSLVAHDLRSPVGNLRSILDLLEDTSLSREEFQQIILTLKADLDYTHSCLETLLTWSASQLNVLKPVFTAVDLHRVADECIGLLQDSAARKAITIERDIPPGASVHADSNQLAAILRNLLANAIKFTPHGGSVALHVLEESSGAWRIKVIDSGIGIPPERLRQLLDPNCTYTTPGTNNERGLGLGLAICSEFIQLHDSKLHIESVPGCGTTFEFSLPKAADETL